MATSSIIITKICQWCGVEFEAPKVSTKYCSHRCANLAYKQAVRDKRVKQAEAETLSVKLEKPIENVKDKDYLYGYRNACSVMWNANGICIGIFKGSLDIHIRFWEYSEGVGNYPDWGIIIARCEFRDELRENRFELLKDLVRFFKEYMPRYGYKHLCTEDDDYKYYQTLNLPCIKRGFMGRHCNYGAPLRDIEV